MALSIGRLRDQAGRPHGLVRRGHLRRIGDVRVELNDVLVAFAEFFVDFAERVDVLLVS